jgi:hypothetical protein
MGFLQHPDGQSAVYVGDQHWVMAGDDQGCTGF